MSDAGHERIGRLTCTAAILVFVAVTPVQCLAHEVPAQASENPKQMLLGDETSDALETSSTSALKGGSCGVEQVKLSMPFAERGNPDEAP